MVCARKFRYYFIEKEMTSGPCPNLLKSTHARHYSFEIDIRENFLDVRFASKANFISSSFSQKRMLWFVVNKIIFSNSSRQIAIYKQSIYPRLHNKTIPQKNINHSPVGFGSLLVICLL